jgi:hypothetical protein
VKWLKNYKIASANVLDKFQTDSNSFQAFKPCAVKMKELLNDITFLIAYFHMETYSYYRLIK